MALNPNFPQMEYGWGALWNANAGDSPIDRYVNVTPRTHGSAGTSRGRQYELDQVQAGTLQLALSNTDGALDPNNGAGPYAGHIWPYQPFRMRAQWPPTANLLAPVIANGGDGSPVGTLDAGSAGQDILSSTDGTGGQIVASGTAYNGTNVLQFNVPSATAVATRIAHTPQPAVLPLQTYTMTMRVRNITPSTSLDVKPVIGWYGPPPPGAPITSVYGTTVTLAGSATAPWTTVTVTATAPTSPYGVDVGVAVATTAAATCSVQVDGWQLEKGSVASAFISPGTWYPVYSGFVERWPQSWDLESTYGLVSPTTVDAFALLSQRQLRDPLTEEIYRRNPTFLYTLADPAGSGTFTDSTGKNPAVSVAKSKYGAGSLVSGVSITSTDAGGAYTGATGTVVRISNSNPGTSTVGPASFINLAAAGIVGPETPNTWARMMAFRWTGSGNPASAAYVWTSFDKQRANGLPSGSTIRFTIQNDGKFAVGMGGPSGNMQGYVPQTAGVGVTVTDGDWHLAGVACNAATGEVWVTCDGVSSYWSGQGAINPTGVVGDSVGGWVDPTVGNGTAWNFKGDISYVMEFPTFLGGSDFSAIYGAWKNAFAGDSTDKRYARILTYAGYNGPSSIQPGMTTSMGPMTSDGTDALSALNDVVTTENGEHYVDRAGVVTFKARSARYNATVPTFTFGERTDLGELPYESVELDYDPTHLANLVTVTQKSTGQTFTAADATSQTNYFPRTMTRDIDSTDPLECQDASNYLLSRYKNPLPRVSTLVLHPAANPALWPACLSLELGTRVRIMRRPIGAPAIQIDAFVEQVQWGVSDKGDATVTLQCSPIDAQPYAAFAAWRTTLSAVSSAGANSITVNAPAFDTVNPLSALVTPGQVLVVGQGGATPDTMTVQSVSNTGTNWTTGTITFTATMPHAHSNGDTVGEALPAGVTNAATWDTLSKFDSIAFAY
jgi:hypothetical protein